MLEAEYVLFGLTPTGYHLTSLGLQATNAVVFMALAAAVLRPVIAARDPD